MSFCNLYHQVIPDIILVKYAEKDIFEIVCMALSAIAPLFAILFTLFIHFNSNRRDKLAYIYEENNQLLIAAMQYPYLEKYDYCSIWSRSSKDDDSLRYSAYCCRVFNVVERLFLLEKKHNKMKKIIDFEEYIDTHQKWWKDEVPATGGYDKGFIEFVNNLLTGERK